MTLPNVSDGHVNFTTMRQELLTKPQPPNKSKSAKTKDLSLTTECSWNEPFVLYYEDQKSDAMSNEESQLKFTIQMGYDEVIPRKKGV